MACCTLTYLQQVADVRSPKTALTRKTIKPFDVPQWPELSLEQMWPIACQIEQFQFYVPDHWTHVRKVDRTYFWNVFSTLAYEYVQDLVDDVSKQRSEALEARRAAAQESSDEESKIRPTKRLARLLLKPNPKTRKYNLPPVSMM